MIKTYTILNIKYVRNIFFLKEEKSIKNLVLIYLDHSSFYLFDEIFYVNDYYIKIIS